MSPILYFSGSEVKHLLFLWPSQLIFEYHMIVIFLLTCYLKLTGDMLEWHNLRLVFREPCNLIFRYILYTKILGLPSRFGLMDDQAAKAFCPFSI